MVGEIYSAYGAPFERYKLDTAVPFMKILIKPETAGSRFFSIVTFVQASLLFITISTASKYCPGFSAPSVAERGPLAMSQGDESPRPGLLCHCELGPPPRGAPVE